MYNDISIVLRNQLCLVTKFFLYLLNKIGLKLSDMTPVSLKSRPRGALQSHTWIQIIITPKVIFQINQNGDHRVYFFLILTELISLKNNTLCFHLLFFNIQRFFFCLSF